MKKVKILKKPLTILTLILAISSCKTINSKSVADNTNNDSSNIVVANYSEGQITLKDVNYEIEKLIEKNDKLKGLTFSQLNQEQKEAIIKEVVLKEISYKEAKKRNLNKDKDYKEALKSFELEILKQKLLFTLAKEAIDEENVKKNYDDLAHKLKDKKDFKISYIAVKTKVEAESAYQDAIKSPNSFASIARKRSIDKDLAKKGGDLGFIVEDALPADVVQQAKSLQKNQISKPFATNGKWVIIKLDDARPAQILPYEKVKENLAQNLAKKAVEDFLKQSIEKAKISVLVK